MGRIISYTEAETLNSDDYLIIDGTTDGTRKIKAQSLSESDAIEDITALTSVMGTYIIGQEININPHLTNQLVSSDGTITNTPAMRLSEFIEIPKSKRIYVSFARHDGTTTATLRVAYYSDNNDAAFISRAIVITGIVQGSNITNIEFNTSVDNAKYVRFCFERCLHGLLIVPEEVIQINSADDLDNITSSGAFMYVSGGAPLNYPQSGKYGFLIVYATKNSSGIVTQIVFDYYNNLYLRRRTSSNVWNNWTQFANINSVMPKPKALTETQDIDVLDDGTYFRNSLPLPDKWPIAQGSSSGAYGFLHCIKSSASLTSQIVFDYNNNLFIRRKSNSGWSKWEQYSKNYSTKTVLPKAAKVFKRVGCIGDSYTEGYINSDGTPVHLNEYAWPKYMESLTGNIWTNFGVSGSSSRSWMAGGAYSKLAEVRAEGNKCQAYVIGLMINDSDTDSSNYVAVGVSSDIGTDTDSFYAWYYKLIVAVHNVNTTDPIFCNTCPKGGSRYTPYNTAVRDIVTYCKAQGMPVYLCDLDGPEYNNTSFYKSPVFTSDATYGHYTSIGYEMMAECYLQVLSDVIVANNAEMKNIHNIPYDIPS